MEYITIVDRLMDQDLFEARVPQLPGVAARGSTREIARQNLTQQIECYRDEGGEVISERAMQWHYRFLKRAQEIASWSKDPRRQVGCYVVDTQRRELASGYNGFPRGVADDARLYDRQLKNLITVHAEANAVATAAWRGVALQGGIAYVTRHPCPQCAALLLQSGIQRVFYHHNQVQGSSYYAQFQVAALLLAEAGVPLARL